MSRLRYDSSRLSLVINVTACSVNLASSWFVEGESKLPVITARERTERESLFEEKAGERIISWNGVSIRSIFVVDHRETLAA